MTEELLKRIERNLGPRPLCRDCADFGPRCETTGDLCDPVENRKEIMEQIRQSLASSPCSAADALTLAGELIAMIRVNVYRGSFKECTPEQIDEHLKPWEKRLRALRTKQNESD